MSESQFAYDSFTLDELRSLAASPQVGTMQAMPQSFRALADRVGEVADLLSHAQADLPNWWKGPAAKQAAATLGRAAAEAREFHDSAVGAATAVSRCAQVVAEQQNQMMHVPDVQEQGVSAVVQRPTTPFEALEAARQDATYQAAHEQAVQVVNGIAAQYVETRSQLADIGAFRAEDFIPTSVSPEPSELNAENPSTGGPYSTKSGAIEVLQFGQSRHESVKIRAEAEESISPRGRTSTSTRMNCHTLEKVKPRPLGDPDLGNDIRAAVDTLRNTTTDPLFNTSSGSQDKPKAFASADRSTPNKSGINPPIDEPNKSTKLHSENKTTSISPEMQLPGEIITSRSSPRPDNSEESVRAAIRKKNLRELNESRRFGTFEASHDIAQNTQGPNFPSPHQEYQPQADLGSNENATMIPPYSGAGSLHRAREERNRCPTYLKERKSVWLPETAAAPADGVITPDWLEHR